MFGNELAALPAGLFDGLPALRTLFLSDNPLTNLPPGIFDGLSSLWQLSLTNNDLAALPDGVFERLGSLKVLGFSDNPGSADFVPAADAGPDRTAAAGGAVTLDGRASLASGPWKSNVTGWQWQQVDASDNVLTPADGDADRGEHADALLHRAFVGGRCASAPHGDRAGRPRIRWPTRAATRSR